MIEDWICCDKCGSWLHYRCFGIEFVPERFFVVFVNDFFYVWCILCIICVGIECVVLNEKYGHPVMI